MCKRLKIILKTVVPDKEGAMSKITKSVFEALSEDMADLSSKIENTDTKINKILDNNIEQNKINSLLLEKLNKIEGKIDADELEGHAFMMKKLSKTASNKWVWIALLGLIILVGMGGAYIIEKSSNISEIANSIK